MVEHAFQRLAVACGEHAQYLGFGGSDSAEKFLVDARTPTGGVHQHFASITRVGEPEDVAFTASLSTYLVRVGAATLNARAK